MIETPKITTDSQDCNISMKVVNQICGLMEWSVSNTNTFDTEFLTPMGTSLYYVTTPTVSGTYFVRARQATLNGIVLSDWSNVMEVVVELAEDDGCLT
jgi:hypothetical protein